jgi:hypothetical protein
LLTKATQASRPAARAAVSRRITRKVATLLRRLGKSSGAVSAPCAQNVERLVGDVQNLALELAS